ncbi:uncharacterized protein PV09_00528 [Verruconis gallopava]|uniref:Bul1 C-terminal domain-containing protein n=1 Tax=Verruconis gallopava TaxID=253628 RepID=A0A0D2APF4_9PEZI|nr:uncharacterized protein PV09_00528 [Verruconis gallopava]KIW08563.1 hypothetical protein PV09_00528 [Verruconis gallopava]
MSASGSITSRTGPGLNIRNMVAFAKPAIEIVLAGAEGRPDAYVNSFSTLDPIQGVVRITARNDTPFDDLEITMHGVTKTYVDKLASTSAIGGRQEATHRFLKLTQPMRDDELPQPRVFAANRTYEYPFTFALPQQLLPKACTHKTQHNGVQETHLQPPPSFGDPELSGFGTTLLDDMAPLMARIQYAVKVQIFRTHLADETQHVISEATKKLRIKPVFDEQPPLDLDIYGCHEDYTLRQEKSIRKGMLKGKLGRLVMEANQPKGFRLPAVPAGDPIPAVSTKVKIKVRFDPADDTTPPPRLSSVSSKLKVGTFFSCTPRHNFPSRSSLAYDSTQGYISEFLSLSSICAANVDWRRHESWESPTSRRTSAASRDSNATTAVQSNCSANTSIPEPSKDWKGKHFYTATLLVPLTLPTNKNFVPTFHTCLVSRVYGLHVSLGVSGQPVGSSVTLKLPVQISAEGSVSSVERRRQSSYIAQAQVDADAAFEPRNIAPPPEHLLGYSRLPGVTNNLPPDYSFPSSSRVSGVGGLSVPVAG